MKDKVYIRVDANGQIAMGHLMRTLSIAEAVRAMGGDGCFITADHNCDEKIQNSGFEMICLESAWDQLNQEIEGMIELIKERQIKCLLVDSYFVTPEYFENLSQWTNIVYIDDLKAFPYKCHSIINYVIGENGQDYSYFGGNVYAGAGYVPLRKEFLKDEDRQLSSGLDRIMVTTGGADMHHFGMLFLDAFLKDDRFADCAVTLIVGSKNTDKEYILDTYSDEKRVSVVVDANNMGALMREADCIVSAGGTTLYEACAAQTPAISYAVADNQLVNVKRFDELAGLYYAGDLREGVSQVVLRILDRLYMMKSVEMREEVKKSMVSVVDGNGAARIASVLLNAIEGV